MATRVENGWRLLEDGRWEAAKAGFEEALADGATPEALEGLSWAAWWLDEAETVFDARERAYRLYRARGDTAGAARMATWLAADQLDFRGATAVAAGWLRKARRLLEPLEGAPEHGWLAFHEGYVAYIRGDNDTAAMRGAEAAENGRRFGVPDLEMLGLALEGATLVARADVGPGMERLDEATATALEGGAAIPIAGAWACCFLVSACTSVLDFDRAAEWCDRIAEFAERYGSRYMLAFCRAEYGEVHLWRGRWGEAESLLEASVEDFSRSRPPMTGGPLAVLAELRRRQGRQQEAEALLDRAGPTAGAFLCRARMALDHGDATEARDLAERLLRRLPDRRAPAAVPALEIVVRAAVEQGEPDKGRRALGTLREIAHLVGTPSLRAAADLAEAVVLMATGEHERARPLLEDAVDGFERARAPFDAARARIELAACLRASQRPGAAEREATAALGDLLELGAVVEAERARRLLGAAAAGPVTAREREVLALLAEGLTNGQIAEQLVLSEHTVHRHVTNILRKLRVPSRAAAVAYAARTGLLGDRPL